MRTVQPGGPGNNQRKNAFRVTDAEVQRHSRAHRNSPHDRPFHLQVIHERAEIVGKRIKPKMLRVAERLRRAMAAGVKGKQANAPGRQKKTERLRHVCAEPMLEKEWRARPAAVAVVKLKTVV